MGQVFLRLFAHLPAETRLGLQNTPPKSLFRNILPINPMASIFCDENLRMSVKTNVAGLGGWGYPSSATIPTASMTETTITETPAVIGSGFTDRLLTAD